MRKQLFDHIIIGGGTAGCVAVAGLVKNGARVLVLEAGTTHRHPLLDMPPGVFKLLQRRSKQMKFYKSVTQGQLGGREIDLVQGNVLGGGSTVNVQAYIRGRADDYSAWDDVLRGNADPLGWGWSELLPIFRRLEGNKRFGNALHGKDGPVTVSDPGHINEMSRDFVKAMQAQGQPFNDDFNGDRQTGVGYFQFTYDKGQRVSTASAFLDPLKGNPNLQVVLGATVRKIIIENGRAVGVIYRDSSGEHEVRSDGDIVLSAGAFITPKLLMLSGIGPAQHLRSHGIEVVADLPGVGQNLVDHPIVSTIATLNGRYSYSGQDRGWRMIRNGLQFKLFKSGVVMTSGLEAGAFINPTDPNGLATHEAYCLPAIADPAAAKLAGAQAGLTLSILLLNPKSRGTITLASDNPNDPPVISPKFLDDSRDVDAMVDGLAYLRVTLGTSPLANKIQDILVPASECVSRADQAAFCRSTVKSNYHPVGTAKMGADDDPMSVLDAHLRVRQIDGLRVCDVSAAPTIPSGNTAAIAMVLGDRCASLI